MASPHSESIGPPEAQRSSRSDETRPDESAAPRPPGAQLEATPPAATAGGSHTSRRRWLAIGLAVAAISVVVFVIGPLVSRALHTISTDDAYVNGHVTIVAPRVAGQVAKVLVDDNNPVRAGDILVQLDREPHEIQVALKKAAWEFAQADLLATQDRLRGIAAQARSNRYRLEHAMEDVRNQLELLKSHVAQLKVEEANLVLAERDFARAEPLVTKAAISQQQFDQYKAALAVAKNRVKSAEQTVQQTRASLGLPINYEQPLHVPDDIDQNFSTVRQALAALLESIAPLGVVPSSYNGSPKQVIQEFYERDPEHNLDKIYAHLLKNAAPIKQSEAKVQQAKADLEQAELNLRYCNVLAEIDGVITRRNLNPGNNVQAGQAVMAIRSLTDIWVDANFKETQLAQLRIGQPVDLQVDMYGGRRHFAGRISGFTMGTGSTLALLPAQNATGNFVKVVQRLPVRIDLENYNPAEDTLFVGLSVIPYVRFQEPPEGPNAGKRLQDFEPRQTAVRQRETSP